MRILVNRAKGELFVSDCEVAFFEDRGQIYVSQDLASGGWRIFQEYVNLERFEKEKREGMYQGAFI